MNIIVLVDMEGATGIDEKKRSWICCGSEDWQKYGRKLITEDLKIIVDVCIRRGARHITICDIHDQGTSIIREEFKADNIKWITSLDELEIIENYYAYGILVGFHSKLSREGILSHTFRPDILDLHINNVSIGELGIYIRLLSEKQIPTIFVTGDYHCIQEATSITSSITGAIVKSKLGVAKNILTRDASNQVIKKKIEEAFDNANKVELVELSYPLNVDLQLKYEDYIDDLRNRNIKDYKIEGMNLKWINKSYQEFLLQLIHITKILQKEMQLLLKNNNIFLNSMEKKYGSIVEKKEKIVSLLMEKGINGRFSMFSKNERKQLEDIIKKLSIFITEE